MKTKNNAVQNKIDFTNKIKINEIWSSHLKYDPEKLIVHKETSQRDDLEIKKRDIKVFNYASQSQKQLF